MNEKDNVNMNENEDTQYKNFNITYQFSAVGTVTISVPKSFTLEQAIQYAKDNMSEVPIPKNWSYSEGSEEIFSDNCDFDDDSKEGFEGCCDQ